MHRSSIHCAISQAPTGCISHANLVAAMLACHASRACVFSTNIDMMVSSLSSQVRRILSKYRAVMRNAQAMELVRDKATHAHNYLQAYTHAHCTSLLLAMHAHSHMQAHRRERCIRLVHRCWSSTISKSCRCVCCHHC